MRVSWSEKQISQHKRAAKALDKIIEEVVEHVKNSFDVTDAGIRKFIAGQYKEYRLKSDKQKSIVAFGKNTANVHYYAKQPRLLKQGDLIMIDIWARLDETGAPFADITWMLYYGKKPPKEYEDAFRIVAQARDRAVKHVENNLKNKIAPRGKEVDATARNYLARRGWDKYFLHGTGHSLGFSSAHGARTRISKKGRRPLPLNVGYTIEPGIYFKDKFGIRSEIDFYIDENYKLIITTKIQKKIINIYINL